MSRKRPDGQPPTRPESRRTATATRVSPIHRLALPAILLLGLVLRLGYLAELRTTPDFDAPLADAAFHDYWAKALVTGNWTAPDGSDPGIRSTPYLRPPGYPYFLAAIYSLGGGPNYVLVRLVQMGLGLVGCALAYSLARRAYGFAAGCAAGLFMASHWGVVYYEGELQEPALLAVLALAAVWMLQGWLRSPALWRIAVAGAFLGLFALLRPNILLVCPAIALWAAWVLWKRGDRRRVIAQVGSLTAGAVVMVAPATIRNWVVARDFVLISCNGAVNFYIGNNERADGWAARIPDLKQLTGEDTWSWFLYPKIVRGVEARLGRPATYSDVSAYFNARAWEYIRANPGHCLALAFKRVALFWGPLEVANNKEVHFERWESAWLRWMPGFPLAFSAALLGLGLLAAARLRNRENASEEPAGRGEITVLLVVFIMIYFASFVPFLAAERFRVPLAPLLAVIGGFAVERFMQWGQARDWRRVGYAAAGLVALLALAQVRWADYEPQLAGYCVARADAFAVKKNWAAAAVEYRRAVQAKPTFLGARDSLAAVLIELGKLDEALAEYRARLAFQPADPETLDRVGRLEIRLGRLGDAEKSFRAAIEAAPQHIPSHLNLGYVLNQLKRHADAAETYRAALAVAPNLAEAHYGLGIALTALGKPAEAEAAYRAAIAARPAYAEAHVNLGSLLAARRDFDGAIAAFNRALEADPRRFEALYGLSSALYSKGDRQGAIDAIRRALSVRPGEPRAQQALQMMESQVDP